MIPEDWEVKRIGDISTAVRGASPRPAGDPRYFNGSFIPWLTVAALTNIPSSQVHVRETVGYLTEEGAQYSRILEKGTLIIANSGATLGVAKILSIRCCANDGVAALLNQRDCDNLFLVYYLNSQTKRLREVVATGLGQPNLNTGLIESLPVPIPPLPEQCAIAEVLSDVDALIAALDHLIAKKRAIKQGAMQQLLTGRTRLPGFGKSSAAYKQTELGMIPKDWEVKRISAAAEIFGGGTPSTAVTEYWDGQIPWVSAGDVSRSEGRYIHSTAESISDLGLASCSARIMPAGTTVIIARGATVGRMAQLGSAMAFNQTCYGLLPAGGTDQNYLYYAMLFSVNSIRTLTYGTVFGTITTNSFEQWQIPLPPLPEQRAIATVLSDIDAEVTALEARREKTRALKQGMMQELLTGRTRLV